MSRNSSRVGIGLVVVAVAAGAACGSDSSSGPSAMVTAVTARVGAGQSGTDGPFDFTGTVSVTGATTVTYRWELSNGELQDVQTLPFDGAGSLSTTYTYSPSLCFGKDKQMWARLDILEPNVIESERVTFTRDCGPILGGDEEK
jgi:hypothetical protein